MVKFIKYQFVKISICKKNVSMPTEKISTLKYINSPKKIHQLTKKKYINAKKKIYQFIK